MRIIGAILAAVALSTASVVAVRAVDHPDSKLQSLEDGCNRTDLGLLGEAALTMLVGGHPTAFASWVYVNGDSTPKTVEGTVLSQHTAGTDLFGVHDTYDMNTDVAPDPSYDDLLSSRNALESPAQIHDEWESGLAPLFAWPSAGDRIRHTGSEIWDCGHWQDGDRQVANSDHIPLDPLGLLGIEKIGGENIELHPLMEMATWRRQGDFLPTNASAPVHASQLDVALSNQGGKAKAVEECALVAPAHPTNVITRQAANPLCSQLQDITGRDYHYVLPAPGPKPSPASRLAVQQDVHYAHHGPAPTAVTAVVNNDHVDITVRFKHVAKRRDLQDFGATWHAWWTHDKTAVHHFVVTTQSITINNNLDGDKGDGAQNPSITPNGEWNMFTEVSGQWINLHDPRPGHVDYAPALGSVPSAKPRPVVIPLHTVAPLDVYVSDGGNVHLFTDARECDQPGYVDCPTQNELGLTGGSAGRSDVVLPVSQLLGHSTTVTIHPPVCPSGTSCPEDKNPVALCPAGCYDVTYRIDDVGIASPSPHAIVGDGTAAATVVDGHAAVSLNWWLSPMTRYGPDQDEENTKIREIIGEILKH